jgi:uncharacterized protein (DUF58 family)
VLYPVAAAALLLVAVVGGTSGPVVLAVPFVLAAAVGLAALERPRAEAAVSVDRTTWLQDEDHDFRVEVTTAGAAWVSARLEGGPGFESEPGVLISNADHGTVALPARASTWGVHGPLELHVELGGRGGLVHATEVHRLDLRIVVHPLPHHLRALVPPRWVRSVGGSHRSKARGEGVEFAEVRVRAPGDPWRSVNWRVTARRRVPWVNDRHPERATDVLLFLDSFGEAVGDRGTTLAMAVEAAMAVARRHLGSTDRVGLVDLGGVLRWVAPGTGSRQLYVVTETLLGSELITTYADKDLDIIPVQGLPPRSIVLALTPLADRRAIRALFDLRARGFDLAVIECETASWLPEARTRSETLAARLWDMERDLTRNRLRRLGVAVARWHRDESIDTAIDRVLTFRRRPTRMSA